MTAHRYTQHVKMTGRLSRGGYMRIYEIRDGDKAIGTRTIYCAKRGEFERVTYALGADIRADGPLFEFNTAAAFIGAYEAQLAAPVSEAAHG